MNHVDQLSVELSYQHHKVAGNKCSCGSGKQFKNCCKNVKQRTIKYELDPRNTAELEGLVITQQGQLFGLKNGDNVPLIGTSEIELSYHRKKGPKVLSRGPVDPQRCFLNASLPLLEYDYVFAIDTNNRGIRGADVSVACFVQCFTEIINSTSAELKYALRGWYELWGISEKAENIAWRELILALQSDEMFCNARIGLLVDSDLGLHQEYNSQKIPIIEEFYLPDNFELFYASSDSGKQNIINRIFSLCDRRSRDLLNVLENDDSEESLIPIHGKPFTHVRQWYPEKDDPKNIIR